MGVEILETWHLGALYNYDTRSVTVDREEQRTKGLNLGMDTPALRGCEEEKEPVKEMEKG